MNRRNAVRVAALVVSSYFLYFDATGQRGLVGPDEPRYASIAHEMAASGDWVTPRLAGEPWFEKPSLLYWVGAVFDSLGDQATRVPVALLSVGFLLLFHWRMRAEFGENEADLDLAKPAPTFYSVRHTFATELLRSGTETGRINFERG